MRSEFGLVLIIALTLGSPSRAGNDHGGGDTVVCRGSFGTSVESLDYYEGRVLQPNLILDLGGPNLSAAEKVSHVIDRLSRLDPERARRYREKAGDFFAQKSMRFVDGLDFSLVDDAGNVPLKLGCSIHRAAIQNEPVNPFDRFYTINRDRWNRLDETGKAGLALHELIYSDARALGQASSVNARAFNVLISSNWLTRATPSDYAAEISKLLAPPSRVLFRKERFTVMRAVGERVRVDLRELLASSPGNVRWSFLEPLPAWLKLNDGVLEGTPQASDAGILKLDAIATAGQDSATAAIGVRVQPDQKFPPVWVTRPLIPHQHLVVGERFRLDLSRFVETAETDHLRIIKVAGPPWVRISPRGELIGTPPPRAVGVRVVTVLASTGYMCRSRARVVLHIDDGEGPRISDRRNYFRSGDKVSLDLGALLETEPDDKVTWQLTDALPRWLRFDPTSGMLTGIPTDQDAGDYRIGVTARILDKSGSGTVDLYAMPRPSGPAPRFAQDPVALGEVCAGEDFSFELSRYLENRGGNQLFFSFPEGSTVPPWVSLAENGELSGTPIPWAEGTHLLTLRVFDGSNLITGHATLKVVECE